jgi:glycosyltransferase involved in cell wall biosynthesis
VFGSRSGSARNQSGRCASEAVRLLIYAGGFAPIGGIETFLYSVALELPSRGVAPSVLCWGTRGQLLTQLGTAAIPVSRLPWRWGCRWGGPDWFLLPFGLRELGRADVVLFGKLFHEPVQRRLSAWKKSRGGPPFILVTPYRPAEMWGDDPPGRDVLESFEVIVVQSPAFAQDLKSVGFEGEIRVLPYLPPACESASPLPPTPPLRIGFLGRLAPQKNLAYLLNAFAEVRRSIEAELWIYGDGPERLSLTRLAERLGIARCVRFHGPVPRGEVARAVDSCHLFAFTSLTEGQCLAALEIVARGRTLVATPVGVFPELLRNPIFGRLAPLNSAEAFAAVVLDQARTVIAAGNRLVGQVQQAFASCFPREEILDQYAQLIRSLAERGRAAGP